MEFVSESSATLTETQIVPSSCPTRNPCRNPKPLHTEARGVDSLTRAVIRGDDVCHQEWVQILRTRFLAFVNGLLGRLGFRDCQQALWLYRVGFSEVLLIGFRNLRL